MVGEAALNKTRISLLIALQFSVFVRRAESFISALVCTGAVAAVVERRRERSFDYTICLAHYAVVTRLS